MLQQKTFEALSRQTYDTEVNFFFKTFKIDKDNLIEYKPRTYFNLISSKGRTLERLYCLYIVYEDGK